MSQTLQDTMTWVGVGVERENRYMVSTVQGENKDGVRRRGSASPSGWVCSTDKPVLCFPPKHLTPMKEAEGDG